MSKRLINAINTNTEDAETKKICDFFANFVKAHSFLLTNGRHLEFKIWHTSSFDGVTTFVVSHLEDSSISETFSTTYSWATVQDILRRHNAKLIASGYFLDVEYVVQFKKNKVAFWHPLQSSQPLWLLTIDELSIAAKSNISKGYRSLFFKLFFSRPSCPIHNCHSYSHFFYCFHYCKFIS